MKKSILLFALLLTFSIGYSAVALPAVEHHTTIDHEKLPPRWEKLGTRQVNFKAERDEIVVTGREGTFTALKLKVNNAGINITKMIVHFRNGQKQDVSLRQNIPAGGETRVIDIKGKKRIIQKVVFYYDTKKRASRRATVELYGRH